MVLWRNPAARRPAISGAAGVLLAVVTLLVDGALPDGWLLGWRPSVDGARVLLGAVTGAVITVSALVFWIRGMFVQLSAGQFSSRVLRWYLADRYQQRVLDFLVGAFGYTATITLGMGDGPTAPTVSILLSVALSLTALIVVIVTITDSARTTELTVIMARVAEDTMQAVRDTHPERSQGVTRGDADVDGDDGPSRYQLRAPASGWVGHLDDELLLAALPADTVVRLWTRAGAFVLRGTVIADVPGVGGPDATALVDAIPISRTRDVANDVELGLRSLVDIALQALAVGTRDATSAYEAINYLASVVQEILLRDLPRDVRVGADGRRIVRMSELTYADYVEIAFDQIRQSGAIYPAVAAALLTALHMLVDTVTYAGLPDRLDPLRRQIELVAEHVARSDLLQADRSKARPYRTTAGAQHRPAADHATGRAREET